MKYNLVLLFLCLGGIAPAWSQKATAAYNAAAHTLTLKSENASIKEVLEQLSAANFDVYITDLDDDFKVKANFTNAPADEVLRSVIPARYHYFYRLSDDALKAVNKGAAASAEMQSGEQRKAASAAQQPPAASLQNDPAKFNLKPAQTLEDKFQKPGAPAGGDKMKAATAIKAGPATKETPAPPLAVAEEQHLVVTFKVTEKGLEAVAAAFESGAYSAPTEETAVGEYALVGRTENAVVYAEALTDPLVARSISDPSKNTYHQDFQQKETYVTVKMPKSYANPANTRNLKLDLGKLRESGVEAFFARRESGMTANDVPQHLDISQSGALDLSKINIKGN